MDFTLTEIDPGTNLVVLAGWLAGWLDAGGAETIELRITAALGGAGRHALIDLGSVEFVASLGLRLFNSVARVMQRRDHLMILYGPSRR